MLANLKKIIKNYFLLREEYLLYQKYKNYTMIPQDFFMANLSIAKRTIPLSGTVVECGVWKGGMSGALAEMLGNQKHYYLYDSFEGLPDATVNDGEVGMNWKKNPSNPWYFDNCKIDERYAIEAMKKANVKHVNIVKGYFEQTLMKYDGGKISLLRLDGDWYESTMVCLRQLFHNVEPNGLIIIDDYYTFEGCSKAVHEFLANNKRVEKIHQFNGVAYIVKQ